MRKKIKKALPLVLWSLLFLWATHASECNITCNHNGSTVTINNSCDITKTVDCRWNNIKLNRNVIVNIKPGGNLSVDLKNNRIDLAPGAKINIDKSAKIDNIFVPPILNIVKQWGSEIKEYTMPNMTTPGSRGNVSKEDLQSWTVPSWVHSIKIDFDAERHEEQCCDHVEFRIYKNGSRVYNLRKNSGWSQHVTYNMSVNPWDTIKIWYYEYHDYSVSRWHSYLKNIKITYTVPKPIVYIAVIKWYLKGIKNIYLQYLVNNQDKGDYKLTSNELKDWIVNDILAKINKKRLITSNGAYKYSDGSVAKDCKWYLHNIHNGHNGYYWIKPGNTIIKAYCDMSNWKWWTFYAVKNGISTSKVSDNNTCKSLGLMLFAPTSKQHYEAGRDFAKSQWMSNLWPLWIYQPTHNSNNWYQHSFGSNKPMNSYSPNNVTTAWFKSINWWSFWASDRTNVTEPNGDYHKTCWLWFSYDSNLNVTWYNDRGCNYSYKQYVCMAKDDK